MLRSVKLLLVCLVAAWGLIGAFGNLADLGGVYDSVLEAASMPAFENGDAPPWKTQSPIVGWLGVATIIGGKLAAFIFCGYGALLMARTLKSDGATFNSAKNWALAGGGLAAASLFGGFTLVGETVFLMFLDEGLAQAGQAAFRYGAFILLIMLFVARND